MNARIKEVRFANYVAESRTVAMIAAIVRCVANSSLGRVTNATNRCAVEYQR